MPRAGKWKAEIGWEPIDEWREDGLSYAQIIAKCREITSDGSAPSNGSLAPHFNEVSRKKIVERSKKYRGTIEGMLNYRLHKFLEKEDKVHTEQPDNRFVTVEELLINRVKDWRVELMYCKEFLEYWKKNENLTKISDVEWRMPCKICGEELIIDPKGKNMQLDHIVPKSREGGTTPDNVIPVHKMCNQAKSSMTMEELVNLADKIRRHNG